MMATVEHTLKAHAALFRAAAEEIRIKGWIQGSVDGNLDPNNPGPCCVGDALMRVYTSPPDGGLFWMLESYKFLVWFLKIKSFSLTRWNDAQGRTEEEVLACLEAAAQAAESGVGPLRCACGRIADEEVPDGHGVIGLCPQHRENAP